MRSVYRYSIRKPKRVVFLGVLITMIVAPGVMRLRLRTDGNALLPTEAAEIKFDRSIRDEFGVRDQIAVVLKSDDPNGVFNPHTLALVRTLTKRFTRLEGIQPDNVISLATEKRDRFFPNSIRNRGFLEPWPRTPQDFQEIRDDLERIQLYTGTLVSYDGSATAILIGVPGGGAGAAAPQPAGIDRPRLYAAIRDIIAEQGEIPEKVYVVGAPIAESLLGTHILEDLGVPSALMGQRLHRGDEPQRRHVPGSFYELRRFIARHVGLVPIAIGIMALVFLLSFRSPAATLLPLGEVGACLIFVFGLMGFCGVPIYLTIAVLPIILTAMGIADEIHIFSRYRQHLRLAHANGDPGPGRPDSRENHLTMVEKTMDEMWRPIVKTSVTTAIGFLSFGLSPISPVRAFGVFTAVGIIFCMLWSVTVIPACLALIGPRRFVRAAGSTGENNRPGRQALLHRLASVVVRRRYVIVLLAVAVLVIAPFGVRRVLVQDSWIDGFSPDSVFYQATQFVNDSFHGTHILLVCADAGDAAITGEVRNGDITTFGAKLPIDRAIDPQNLIGQWLQIRPPETQAPPSGGKSKRYARQSRIEQATVQGRTLVVSVNRKDGSLKLAPSGGKDELLGYDIRPRPFLSPEVIQLIADLEAFIASHREEGVGGVLGTAAYITTINYMAGNKSEKMRRIPDEARRVRWLWHQYARVRGQNRLREIVDPNHARTLITVFMENANFVATRHLMNEIRGYERTHLAPHGIKLGFAGDVAVSQALIKAIVTTQVRSLLLSLLGILAVTILMGRSFGWGIYCVLPCCLAVLVNFAVMGLLRIPLGVATSMFSAMTLGIGVDYAIHLTERFRHAARRGLSASEAAVDAVVATGPAVALDALAIALGFGVMILSQVPSNARLGGLVVMSVVNCLVATLLLLPALLTIWQPKALYRARGG